MPTTPQDRKTSKKTGAKKATAKKTTTAAPPPQRAETDGKYGVTTWGSVGGMEDLTVPSGQVCLVKRPGVQGLMTAGVLHNIDSLTALVGEKHLERVKPTGKKAQQEAGINMASLMKDEKAMEQVLHTVDRVVCHVVVKPEVHMTPNDVTRRVDGVIYADMVDLVDKMFIFNFVVGGTRDLESFRDGLSDGVGGLEAVEGSGGDAE